MKRETSGKEVKRYAIYDIVEVKRALTKKGREITMKIDVAKVKAPVLDHSGIPIMLTDETIEERKQKVIQLMKEAGYSSLVIYADKEHGSNFEYLVGFIPRFEEALLVFNADGSAGLILGNENFNKVPYSRIKAEGQKCSLFSLPNQPMGNMNELTDCLKNVTLDQSENVGLIGWKLLPDTSNKTFDLPHFVLEAIQTIVPDKKLYNATDLLVGPVNGARTTNNANEIAHYEFGASLASDGVLESMNHLQVGAVETDIGNYLNRAGQYNSVVTITAFGPRFIKGNVYPTENKLDKGDKVALTVAYKGGLSSRSGYAVSNRDELEEVDKGYFDEVVAPYFSAYHFWLQNVKIGKNAGEFYEAFEKNYPQATYGWELCPGHLTSDEEWLSSPFYAGSKATVQSGMLFQVDFIPSQKGHNGISAESTVAVADEKLREEIASNYPELWARIESRRRYLAEELNIQLDESLLPLASTLGYYRPFLLDKDTALVIK